ncbi:hypothetical protein L345_03451, partial [Ophiophagus hannah]
MSIAAKALLVNTPPPTPALWKVLTHSFAHSQKRCARRSRENCLTALPDPSNKTTLPGIQPNMRWSGGGLLPHVANERQRSGGKLKIHLLRRPSRLQHMQRGGEARGRGKSRRGGGGRKGRKKPANDVTSAVARSPSLQSGVGRKGGGGGEA